MALPSRPTRSIGNSAASGIAALVLLCCAMTFAGGQSVYPNRMVRLVVGFAPGGGNDIVARIVGQRLADKLGQPVIVENKAGAAGRIAAEYVSKQPNDGYTLLVAPNGPMSVAAAIYPKLQYHPTRSFVPIAAMARFPASVLVVSVDQPIRTVKALVDFAKANPEKSNYATVSPSFSILAEILKLKSAMPAQPINYRSGNEAIVSVLGGHALFTFADSAAAVPMVKGGQVRALAVTGPARLEEIADVPSMVEAGFPEVDMSLWSGVFAPAGTSVEVIARLQQEILAAVKSREVQEKLRGMGVQTLDTGSEQFSRMIDDEIKTYSDVVRAANLSFGD